jgi:hypothetical protein
MALFDNASNFDPFGGSSYSLPSYNARPDISGMTQNFLTPFGSASSFSNTGTGAQQYNFGNLGTAGTNNQVGFNFPSYASANTGSSNAPFPTTPIPQTTNPTTPPTSVPDSQIKYPESEAPDEGSLDDNQKRLLSELVNLFPNESRSNLLKKMQDPNDPLGLKVTREVQPMGRSRDVQNISSSHDSNMVGGFLPDPVSQWYIGKLDAWDQFFKDHQPPPGQSWSPQEIADFQKLMQEWDAKKPASENTSNYSGV